MTNAAQLFKERVLAGKLAAAVAAEQAAATEPGAPDTAPSGNAALDWKKRQRAKEAQARLAQLRSEREDTRLQQVTQEQEGFALQLHQLELDEKRLRELPRGQARDELILGDLLPNWRPMVEQYLDGGEDYPNPILVLVMIWAFNVGEIAFALRCALVAIAQNQHLPERFKRNIESFVADVVLEWAEAQAARGEPVEPYFGQVAALVTDWLVPDQVRIKYLKFQAKGLEEADPEQALWLYRQAVEIDPALAKCKTAIEKLEKLVARAAEAAGQ